MEISDMSFSVSLDQGRGCEWGTRNGFYSLFAQKKNVLNPYFWQMIREFIRFKQDVISYLEELDNNPDIDCNETLGQFIGSHGYSELFQKAYLVKEELEKIGCQIRTGCEVNSVSTNEQGCSIACNDGATEVYDGCIIAVHAPHTLKMLGKEATNDETRILSAFHYVYSIYKFYDVERQNHFLFFYNSDTFLHHDKTFLPRNPAVWSACNFFGTINNKGFTTYWLNIIQNLGESKLPYLVTVDPPHTPEHTLVKWRTRHLVPSVAASKASRELHQIQGKRGIWFCGAYHGYGSNVNGLKVVLLLQIKILTYSENYLESFAAFVDDCDIFAPPQAGAVAADGMLRRNCSVLYNLKHLVPTWPETGARLLVTRFFKSYIQTGCIILLEGGTIFTFQGTDRKCSLKVSLTVHNMQFYWKVATQADLGLADAFIHGDFSFVDKNEGLLNLFMIFIANRDLKASVRTSSKKRGWWTPLLFTAALSSAKYFIRHSEDEDLKVAQLRKNSLLIEKAKISKEHHILEIGFGWGTLAMEVVKQTGCKYTGITFSEKQLEYAQLRVEQAGLQDQITFLLCDYRQIPNKDKYDKIISCEMLEAVGHEFMEEFFTCCESALAEDGLLVLQFISTPDVRYSEYIQNSDFIKEYIFPGACVPALSRVTSAMAAASRLCQIRALGFDDKFVRTWEYYFDYCAAGFKTCTLGDYQIVFSRPGNVAAFGDPYNVVPSTY
uniref:Cyclopropane fatty acid synthase n=1 Tax=Solanum tuberosum TaxID=4113 RepID=M1AB31_SOLTU